MPDQHVCVAGSARAPALDTAGCRAHSRVALSTTTVKSGCTHPWSPATRHVRGAFETRIGRAWSMVGHPLFLAGAARDVGYGVGVAREGSEW